MGRLHVVEDRFETTAFALDTLAFALVLWTLLGLVASRRRRGRRDAAALRVVVPLLLLLPASCASWRPLEPTTWDRAETHADLFRTRLRVTRLDGRRLYVEHPRWTATHLQGAYPAGWPAVAPADSVLAIPRDSIARVERLESDRGRTALYLSGVLLLLVGAATLAGR
jgi:hypothetical protein